MKKIINVIFSVIFSVLIISTIVKFTVGFKQLYYLDIDYLNIPDLSGLSKEDIKKEKTPKEKETVFALRKAMSSMPVADVTEQVITEMTKTKNNKEFVEKMDAYLQRFK